MFFFRYKLNGQNFRIDIPQLNVDLSGISIPEELVGIQSYLRWERKGKQNYSPGQEKVYVCDEDIMDGMMVSLLKPSVYLEFLKVEGHFRMFK
jgi:hypothetical protein